MKKEQQQQTKMTTTTTKKTKKGTTAITYTGGGGADPCPRNLSEESVLGIQLAAAVNRDGTPGVPGRVVLYSCILCRGELRCLVHE
jgi:hypothetical protein